MGCGASTDLQPSPKRQTPPPPTQPKSNYRDNDRWSNDIPFTIPPQKASKTPGFDIIDEGEDDEDDKDVKKDKDNAAARAIDDVFRDASHAVKMLVDTALPASYTVSDRNESAAREAAEQVASDARSALQAHHLVSGDQASLDDLTHLPPGSELGDDDDAAYR